ncbi:MAG: glutamate racemase [Verrucomicrobiota bacterium]
MGDNRPLGVFDSGVGGLTVVREINRLLPAESIIYLGDTARVPYGNKSPEAVQRYALEDSKFLISRDVKAIVVACNTASAYALDELKQRLGIPVIGVIRPGVEAALEKTRTGKIGIIATAGTIASDAYQQLILSIQPEAEIFASATPLLVPLIEENWLDRPASRMVAEEYLSPFLSAGVDTLVLACTHYPLIRPLLQGICGEQMVLVDSASTCARHTQRRLAENNLEADQDGKGWVQPCLTDTSDHFFELATRFLERSPGEIERVKVDVS